MAQKLNPKSIRLGITQLWNIFVQPYGSNYKILILFFFNYLKSWFFFFKIFSKNKIFINSIEFWHTNSNLLIKVYTNKFNFKYYSNKYLKKIIYILFYWFYFNKFIKIYFYTNNLKFYTSSLLLTYLEHLYKNLNYTPKKIIAILSLLLKKISTQNKITLSKKGPLKLKLKGYKIILNGRFENSKNQMAKKLIIKHGSLKLISINNYIDFSNKNFHTKLGACNIKLWLFYKIN